VLTVITITALLLAALVIVSFRWQADRRETADPAAAAPRTGRFVRAADVDLFVQELGPPGGPPVVLVHGTGAWSGTWRDTMSILANAGYRAIAVDLPPFGFSRRPPDAAYGPTAQGRRIAGALDALGVGPVVLVGHSFGAGPTVEAVLLQPQRIRGLVLVDAALGLGDGTAPPSGSSDTVRGILALRPLRDALVATFLTNPMFTRRLLGAFVADPERLTDERVAIYQQPLSVRGTTAAVGEWLPELLAPGPGGASRDAQTYRRLTAPVLVVWGEADTVTPLPEGRYLASLPPKARLVILPGVGHIPQIEHPPAFEQALIAFLQAP
jgi:pimeloyl-ACP methyl ester carboxylesterase